MEWKETVKIEDSIIRSSSSFSDHFPASNPLAGTFDLFTEDEKSSVGFMELLGIQNFTPSSTFGILQVSAQSVEVEPFPPASEVLNQPTTPNSSSISSASSGAPTDEQSRAVDEEQEQQKTKRQLKPKKTSQKGQREPRFAFVTKSEVDHLEDGYRWRKYGQKAVKNSSFPRSYYRCTTATCNVKKRVERCFGDPSLVVTTYEGKHTHPSPAMSRPSSAGLWPEGPGFSYHAPPRMEVPSPFHQSQFNDFPSLNLNCGYLNYSSNPNAGSSREGRFCSPSMSALLADHGLLQDIVPPIMRNED